jgi:hypothetical protein
MTDRDDGDPPHQKESDDELAKKLSRLSADQQALYRNQVDVNHERNGRVSRDYQFKLADSLLKNLNPSELGREIAELNRQEFQYTYWRNQAATGKDAKENQPTARGSSRPEQTPPKQMPSPQQDRPNTLVGKIPHAPPRDYTELQRSHEQTATQIKAAERNPAAPRPHEQTAAPPTPVMPKQTLALMIEHFPEIRREANLPTTQAEIHERAELARAQDIDRTKLDQMHGPQPNQKQRNERDLLDHQHLAEQVGVQAKWIANHLKARALPASAEQYGKDFRQAFATARHLHEQRQKLGLEIDRHADPQRGADAQHQHADRQASLSPEATHPSHGDERSAGARQTTGRSKDQSAQKGNSNPGKSPSGGRGGR